MCDQYIYEYRMQAAAISAFTQAFPCIADDYGILPPHFKIYRYYTAIFMSLN